jgi:hypothetical protein
VRSRRGLTLASVIAGPLPDDRDPLRFRHSYVEMVKARMMIIAAGYEDCDAIDDLRTDPALKVAVGRAPETGTDLMSQPTLSRLENLAGWRTLARIGLKQIDLHCRSSTVSCHSGLYRTIWTQASWFNSARLGGHLFSNCLSLIRPLVIGQCESARSLTTFAVRFLEPALA